MDNVTPSLKDYMMFLQLDNVSRNFGGLLAVNAIDLSIEQGEIVGLMGACLLYTSPSPRDLSTSRMPSSA